MDRVLRGSTSTARLHLYDGETAVDSATTPTVVATRDDGAVLVAPVVSKPAGTTGEYVAALIAAHTSEVDRLSLVWSTSFGTRTTTVEIVGGFYFELPDLRGMGLSAGDYSPSRLAEARSWIEDLIDREVGTSFVSRYRRASLDGSGSTILGLSRFARRIIGVTVDGVALPPTAVSAVKLAGGDAVRDTWWPLGVANVDVRYVSGWGKAEEPPADVRHAALTAAKAHLLGSDSGLPARARGITNEFGNIALGFAGRDRPTGDDEVDVAIIAWRDLLAAGDSARSIRVVRP